MFRVLFLITVLIACRATSLNALEPPTHASLHSAVSTLARQVSESRWTAREVDEVPSLLVIGAAGDEKTRAATLAVRSALEQLGFRTSSQASRGGQDEPTDNVIRVRTESFPDRELVEVNYGENSYKAFHLNKDWVDDPSWQSDDADFQWFRVRSDFHFDEQEASREADERLVAELLKTLSQMQARDVTEQKIRSRLAALIASPDNRHDSFMERNHKEYGTAFRRNVLIRLPRTTISSWSDELVQEQRNYRTRLLQSATLTAVTWFVALMVAIRFDRWTCGYRRPVIVLSLVLLIAATCLLWKLFLL